MMHVTISNAGAETLLRYAIKNGLKGSKDAKISGAIHRLILQLRAEQEKETVGND